MADPTSAPSGDDLPAAAIAIIACSCWIGVIVILLVIRQCCKARGMWPNCDCSQSCRCCDDTGEASCLSTCLRALGETCDCTSPSTRAWCDSVCPSKESCNQCCYSCASCFLCPQREGDCCQGQQCNWGQCCTCPQCPDCTCPGIECPNCACECQPPQCDVLYCFCCQITLGGGQARPT